MNVPSTTPPPPSSGGNKVDGSDDCVLAVDNDGGAATPSSSSGPRLQSICGLVVHNRLFMNIMVACIVINSAMMGLATFDVIANSSNLSYAFAKVDQIFLIIFTIELGLQFGFHHVFLFRSGWLTFDFIIIVTSWTFSPVQVFLAFRCLRLAASIRIMKVVVNALHGAASNLFAVALTLLVLHYVFAVMFTELFKELYSHGQTSHDYFSRLDKTFFTLFQLTTGAGWADITREVMLTYEWAWLPFVTFITLSTFTVIHLAIAILCDSMSKLHDDNGNGGDVTHQDKMKKHEIVKTNDSNSMEAASTALNMAYTQEDVARLEQKINILMKQIEILVQQQQK